MAGIGKKNYKWFLLPFLFYLTIIGFMSVALYKTRLSEKLQLSTTYYFLKLELLEPHKLLFQAGQYILLNCPTTPQKRQYSIVSAPRLDHAIELLIEYIPQGKASEYIRSLEIGDEVSFYAPAGEFVLQQQVVRAATPLVFIATGSGLAPLRSMILDLLRTHETKRSIQLYWGMREAQSLFWLDYWQELKENYTNFSYHIVLSQPPPEWKLCQGRVTNCLLLHEVPQDGEFYVCGSQRMITDVVDVLGSRGIETSHIHYEKFRA